MIIYSEESLADADMNIFLDIKLYESDNIYIKLITFNI